MTNNRAFQMVKKAKWQKDKTSEKQNCEKTSKWNKAKMPKTGSVIKNETPCAKNGKKR